MKARDVHFASGELEIAVFLHEALRPPTMDVENRIKK